MIDAILLLPWQLQAALCVLSLGAITVAVLVVWSVKKENDEVSRKMRGEGRVPLSDLIGGAGAASQRCDASPASVPVHDEHEAMGEYDLLAAIRITKHATN